MKESELVELLNHHADALKDGRDFSPEPATKNRRAGKELSELLTVADRVKSALKPVTPRPAFVRELKQRLTTGARLALEEEVQRRQRQWLIAAAGLGGLVYTLGVLAFGIRSSLWLLSLIGVWLGWKKRHPAARVAR